MKRISFRIRMRWLAAAAALLVLGSPVAARDFDALKLAEGIKPEVRAMMLEGRIPSAAVALVSRDGIIFQGGFGNANLWARTPAVPSTVYLIGSTFKTMSMTALLQLMEQGRFKLDDPVNDYLKDIKIRGEDPENPVTFRHLLTHTSGLPGDFGGHNVWGNSVPSPLKEYLARKLELSHPTMSRTLYSNLAYSLIGYLVQDLSGVPYKKYMRDNIFAPLEMDDTDFFPRPDMEERLSIPYVVDTKNSTWKVTPRVKADVWPAGIVYGTVLNQANWLICQLNEGVFKGKRLISRETFHEIMTRQYDRFNGPLGGGWLNDTTGYGLTWWISEQEGDRVFAHSGSVSGYTAFLAGNLDKGTGIAVLTNGNRAHPHLYKLAANALALMEDCRADGR